MSLQLLLCCVLGVDGVLPKPEVIAKTDPVYSVLMAHQKSMLAEYEKGRCKLPEFAQWQPLRSKAASSLFPNHRFATITWNERRHPKATKPVSLAAMLRKTLVIDEKKNRIVRELYAWGNYEPFGEMLIKHGVQLKTDADAQLILQAFLALHRKGSSQLNEQVTDNEWRLGVSQYDQSVASDEVSKTVVTRKHYTRVTSHPETHVVTSWKSVVETSNRRRVFKEKVKTEQSAAN